MLAETGGEGAALYSVLMPVADGLSVLGQLCMDIFSFRSRRYVPERVEK
jgi:hypothetical protein